jgi:hydrogenase maturation protease
LSVAFPILVLAVGNPSRGDDALGPLLAERMERAELPGVEVLVDFQLQIEHALDLEGRTLVIFVDAGTGTPAPFHWLDVAPVEDYRHSSHSLSPGAVLATCRRCVDGPVPAARLLCVRGDSFELGASLSGSATRYLELAWASLYAACIAATARAA